MVEDGDRTLRRQRRVSEALREEISKWLVGEAGDPLLAWTDVTGVDVSADLQLARVFFVPTRGADSSSVRDHLERAAPRLQRRIGDRLRLRRTPRLSFRYDESRDHGERVDLLVEETRRERELQSAGDDPVEQLADRIGSARRILVATHVNPDGDAIGSLLGMHRILRLMGKTAIAFAPEGVPSTLQFLPGVELTTRELEDEAPFDLTLLLDTADESLFPPGFPGADRRGELAVIDHHPRHGEIGDVVVRREASAVGEILYDLARELTWPLDREVAACLYASIVSDTGSFRYSSTTGHTHRVAADLVELGAEPWPTATSLYESYPLRRQRLLTEVLGTLEVHAGGGLAVLSATRELLAECGADKADLDGMVNFGRAVEGVEIAAMLRVEENGGIKVSFRSKGRYDVGDLAAAFGGGGHDNAAACTLEDIDLAEARSRVIEAASRLLASGDDASSSS